MKLPRKFGLASLLAFVAISALSITAYSRFSASGRYKRNGDVETFCYLLSTQIESGDTLATVVSVLGPGTRDDGTYLNYMVNRRFGARHNSISRWPDGIEEDDLFILYSASPMTAYGMQFRNGILVNHDPKWYAGPDVMVIDLRVTR